MAQSKFTIYKYVKLKNGSWRYYRAAFYSNGKIKPNRCIVAGREGEHSEGGYYLYHHKKWIPVGADALEAQRWRIARLDDDEFKWLQGTAPPQIPNIVPMNASIASRPLVSPRQPKSWEPNLIPRQSRTGAGGRRQRDRLSSHFSRMVKDPVFPKHLGDGGHVWGVAPGAPPKVIRTRILDVERTLEKALRLLDSAGVDWVATTTMFEVVCDFAGFKETLAGPRQCGVCPSPDYSLLLYDSANRSA